jgi:chromosome segregation ATPase
MDKTAKITLTGKVEKFKLIARDALRMNLITPRLSAVSRLEKSVADVAKATAEVNHEIEVLNYDISKLDVNHPDYADKKSGKEDRVKSLSELLTDNAKETADLTKEIANEKDGIAKIEAGETKVSLDELNALVAKLIEADALSQVNG